MMITNRHNDSRMTLLFLVARELSESLDLDQIARRVLIATVRIAGASHGSFITFDEWETLKRGLAVSDTTVTEVGTEPLNLLLNEGLAGWVKTNREPVLLEDASTDERWYVDPQNKNLLDHRSVISVPLLAGQKLLGVLTVSHQNPHYFDVSDLTMLIAIAEQATTAILNARLYQTEQNRRKLANTLAETLHQMNATHDLDELFHLILNQLASIVDHDQSAIYLWNEGRLTMAVARGLDDISELQSLPISMYKDDFARPIINQHLPGLTSNLQNENSWFRDVTDIAKQSWMGIPLIAENSLLGLITVSSERAGLYTEEDLQIANTLAGQAATAIRNTRLVNRLQSAQKRYTQLFEESSDLLLLINPDGIIQDANRRACQIFRRPKDTLIGSYLVLLGPNLRSAFNQQLPALNSGEEITEELEVKNAFGQQTFLEINAKQVEIDGQIAIQWAGRDVTARYELARLREDLTHMIVHDLRGPTGTLMGTIQILSMILEGISGTETYTEAMDMINIANRTGRYLQDLINSVLDLSKMEQGDFPLNKTSVSLAQLFATVKEQTAPQANMKQIAVSFQPVEDETIVQIDQSLIRRVIVNLVDNATKYTPSSGSIEVTFSLNERELLVSVADNGPGITAEDQKYLFDKFSRATKDKYIQGVGLGLAFCQMAIEAHQGKIWVESELGSGSKFTFTISAR